MRILISVDIANLLCRPRHLTISAEIIEEHKSAIEVNTFKDKVSNECFHQAELISFLMELIVTVANKLITVQEVLIGLPLIKNVVTLFRTTDSVEHVAITLTMDTLLECLNMQTEVYLVCSDILTKGWEVIALKRIKENKEAQNLIIGCTFSLFKTWIVLKVL